MKIVNCQEIIENAEKSGLLCFDVEHNPNLSWEIGGFNIHGCGFSTVKDGEIICYYSTDYYEIQSVLGLFPKVQVIAHNAKYDLHCIRSAGFKFEEPQIRDTMIMYNLINENLSESELGLKKLVKSKYRHSMMEFSEASNEGLDSEKFRNYALEDVYFELKLFLDGEPILKALQLWNLYTRILSPSLYVFFEIEHFGMNWDESVCSSLYRKLSTLRSELESQIYKRLGKFNINSGDQLSKILFETHRMPTSGIKYMEKSKRFSVDADSMQILARRHPVCEKIMAYRTCDKMISTYLEPLLSKSKTSKSGRVHASFWLTSATGRTRCSSPNLQNVPTSLGSSIIHDVELKSKFDNIKLRSGFTAPPGHKLIVADFSQIELRLGAIVSGEKELLDAYRNWNCFSCGGSGTSETLLKSCPSCNLRESEKDWKSKSGFWHGQDLHSKVLTHVPEKIRSRLTRSHGKSLNFLVLYGGSPSRLQQEYPELSYSDCEAIIESIMRNRPKLRGYHAKIKSDVVSGKEIRDFYGRRRKLPNKEIIENTRHSINQCVNFPVQSFAVNLMHLSLISLRKRLIQQGNWGRVKIVNVIHDELVVECPLDCVEEVSKTVIEAMESHKLPIPIRVELKVVDNWGECK